jgi:hypothetical protein
MKCDFCKRNGASFYCHAPYCHKKGHYLCATNKNWDFNWGSYQAFCPKEKRQPVLSNTVSQTITLTNRPDVQQDIKMEI